MNKILLSVIGIISCFITANGQTSLSKPVILPATNITTKGFTANWKSVENAEAYCVFVYTEHIAKQDETYTVLHEDFDLIDFGTVGNPVWSEELYENLDIYTSLPNWTVYGYTTYAQGMVGGIVYSPYIDLRNNNGKYTINLSVYGESGDEIFINTNGTTEDKRSFVLNHTGISTVSFTFNNGRKDTFFHLNNSTGNEFYVDEVQVTQDLKAGDKAYVYVDLNDAVLGTKTSVDFKNLRFAKNADTVYYDLYAVVRVYNDPEHPDRYEQVYSDFSDMEKVVLNPDATKIQDIDNQYNTYRLNNDGITIYINKPSHVNVYDVTGRNIISGYYEEGTRNIHLSKGIYILSIGDKTQKINI